MLRSFRRVVTGVNAAGRSTILSDALAPIAFATPEWPTRGTTLLWGTQVPADNGGNVLAEDTGQMNIIPGVNALSLIVMEIAPISELDAMTEEQRAAANAPVGGTFPGSYRLDTSQGPHMHATDTVDLCMVLSGEVTFYADEGAVTLKPFDTIIDRGANHGWVNHGTEPCLVISAVVNAKTLDRSAYGEGQAA